MANQKIRIRLKSYDHRLLDQSAQKIVETAKSCQNLKKSSKINFTHSFSAEIYIKAFVL